MRQYRGKSVTPTIFLKSFRKLDSSSVPPCTLRTWREMYTQESNIPTFSSIHPSILSDHQDTVGLYFAWARSPVKLAIKAGHFTLLSSERGDVLSGRDNPKGMVINGPKHFVCKAARRHFLSRKTVHALWRFTRGPWCPSQPFHHLPFYPSDDLQILYMQPTLTTTLKSHFVKINKWVS